MVWQIIKAVIDAEGENQQNKPDMGTTKAPSDNQNIAAGNKDIQVNQMPQTQQEQPEMVQNNVQSAPTDNNQQMEQENNTQEQPMQENTQKEDDNIFSSDASLKTSSGGEGGEMEGAGGEMAGGMGGDWGKTLNAILGSSPVKMTTPNTVSKSMNVSSDENLKNTDNPTWRDKAKDSMGKVNNFMDKYGDKISKGIEWAKAMDSTPVNMVSANQVSTANQVSQVSSDENLKEDLKRASPIELFSNIDAYTYKYTPEAREMYQDEANGGTVNDKENFGIMAQDLEANPLTAPAVHKDENGYLSVDGARLSSINTAILTEVCKKVMELEARINGR